MMKKLSYAQIRQVIEDGAVALRSVTVERDHALDKLASMERRRDAEKLASHMHHKGLEIDREFGELADDLEKQAAAGHLSEIKRAVDMVGPNMAIKTAHLASDEVDTRGGQTDLERYLYGDVG